MFRMCFVCLGNICRSPTAEGIMLHAIAQAGLSTAFAVESAGTADYHVGEWPDRRSLAAAKQRGVTLPSRARQWLAEDFRRFDLVLAMDSDNHAALLRIAPDDEARAKVRLLRSFDSAVAPDAAVPDPYYGGIEDFEHVLDLCEAAARGLLARLAV